MASALSVEKPAQPTLAKHDSSILDLVFVMDCTGSMGSYIQSARENIRGIVEEIVASEKSDIQLALIEYRDHPPQDQTFVTRVHDFTSKVREMKKWLEECNAEGGGDTPEAVSTALHDVLKLSWRPDATKICVLISDAPPHGLDPNCGDGFPAGDPNGVDPIKTVRDMAEKKITLYAVGVEPPIVPYRDFFMTLAYLTGGQYVPMVNAKLLAKVIIGGVREEISLERLMKDSETEIAQEMQQAEAEGADEVEITTRVNRLLLKKNTTVKQLDNAAGETSDLAKSTYSKCADLSELRSKYVSRVAPADVITMASGRTRRMAAAHRAVPYAAAEEVEASSAASAPPNPMPSAASMDYNLRDDTVSMSQTERIVRKIRSKK